MSAGAGDLEALYQMGEVLGRGGFGTVYRAHPRAGGRAVAVKLPEGGGLAAERPRVWREARLLQGLEHPHLVPLLGVHEARDGRLALVYRLVEGEGLEVVLERGPVAPALARRWLRELGAALDALHGAGLVHRDVKAANVRIEAAGGAVLLDYGLARPEAPGETLTSTGILVGTPGSMAPELYAGARAGPASDRYALAVLAFQLFTGRVPFPGDPAAVMRAQRQGPPRPAPGEPGGDAALFEALRRGLAVDPEERPASASALAASLEPAAGPGAAPTTRRRLRTTAPRRPPRPEPPRWWRMVAWIGAAGVVLGWRLQPPVPGPAGPAASPARASAPEPAPPGGPFDGRLPERIVVELEEAQLRRIDAAGRVVDAEQAAGEGLRELLDPDPVHFGGILRHLPATAAWFDWVADGGHPEELPESLRQGLARADQHFRGQNLAAPFAPLLETRAATAPVQVRELGLGRGPVWDFQARGWLATALAHWARARRFDRELDEAMKRGDYARLPQAVLENIRDIAAVTDLTSYKAVELTFPVATNRAPLRQLLAPGLAGVRRGLVALGRSLRDEPATRDLVTELLLGILPDMRVFFFSELADLEVDWILGARPEEPAQMVLAAQVLSHQHLALRRARGDWQRLFARERALWRRLIAGGPGTGTTSRMRWAYAAARVLDMEVEMEDFPAARALAGELRQDLAAFPPRERVRFAYRFLDACLTTGDPMGADRGALEAMVGWVRRDHGYLPGAWGGSVARQLASRAERELLGAPPAGAG